MKPHLRLVRSGCWMCAGDTCAVFGTTPVLAYWEWYALQQRVARRYGLPEVRS